MRPFLENYRFNSFSVDGVALPSVMLGTSPFIGAAQFGARALIYRAKFLLQPRNMVEIIRHCVGLGVNAVQAVGYPEVMNAIREAAESSGSEIFVLGTVGLGDVDEEMDLMLGMGARCVVVHGSLADGRVDRVCQRLSRLKKEGVVTGIATHKPGITIPIVEGIEEVQVVLSPLNGLGRYMEPSFESSLEAIEASLKKIIAIKPLAGGRLSPEEGFEYISRKVDGVAVGVTSLKEAQETFGVARRFFS